MATENLGANENKKAGEGAKRPRPADGKTPVKKKKIIIVTGIRAVRVPDSGVPIPADLTPAAVLRDPIPAAAQESRDPQARPEAQEETPGPHVREQRLSLFPTRSFVPA